MSYFKSNKNSNNIQPQDWREVISYPNAHMFASGYITKVLGLHTDFEWNRYAYECHSFDDMNFRYKNNVFSVLFNIYHNGELLPINPERKKHLLSVAKTNNLIPCIFPIEITDHAEENSIRCKESANLFNLFDLRTEKGINPITMASDKNVQLSHYELLNQSIKIVEQELRNSGYSILAICDDPADPDDTPRLWFNDDEGNACWVVIKYGFNKNFETPNVKNMIKKEPLLSMNKGYFAPVVFEYDKKKLCRNKNLEISMPENVIGKIYDPFKASNS